MEATWKFRTICDDRSSFYVMQDDQIVLMRGTDVEALEFSKRFRRAYGERVKRLEIESEGPISEIGVTPGRVVCSIKEWPDNKGWVFEDNHARRASWNPSMEGALNYGAFLNRKELCEIRVFDTTGTITKIVLIDQRKRSK